MRETELDKIKKAIDELSALEYAEIMLKLEETNFPLKIFDASDNSIVDEKTSYYEYMKSTWSGKATPTLEECREASYESKIRQYADLANMYAGWIKNGRLFILDKRDKMVLFLFRVFKSGYGPDAKVLNISAHIHYNPNEVDCIEENLPAKYFEDGIMDERYEVSKNEAKLIKMLDELSAPGTINP